MIAMDFREIIRRTTLSAAGEFFMYCAAVPEDKLDWQPAEGTRSVRELMREVAWCPKWAADIVSGKPFEWSEEIQAQMKETESHWVTVEECERVFREHFAQFDAVLETFPAEKLAQEMPLPFDTGGKIYKGLDNLEFPHWNIVYHLGQVAYIQKMYGDHKMYWAEPMA